MRLISFFVLAGLTAGFAYASGYSSESSSADAAPKAGKAHIVEKNAIEKLLVAEFDTQIFSVPLNAYVNKDSCSTWWRNQTNGSCDIPDSAVVEGHFTRALIARDRIRFTAQKVIVEIGAPSVPEYQLLILGEACRRAVPDIAAVAAKDAEQRVQKLLDSAGDRRRVEIYYWTGGC